jgi:hypothetical protein
MNSNNEVTASQQIDIIVQAHDNWKQEILMDIRATLLASSNDILEEVKWKTPSRPLGLPVWSREGILCFAEIWKDNVKLIFAKGARMENHQTYFNARLKSADIRAIEFREGDKVGSKALKILSLEAIRRA